MKINKGQVILIFISTGIFICSILSLNNTNKIILDQQFIKTSLETEKELIRNIIYEVVTQEEHNLLKNKDRLEDKLYIIQDKPSTK